MAKFFPDEFVDEVKQRNEISSVIASYFPLKRAGRNFKALCPFHNEKTPSFHVNVEKQIFHCFGCGKGGNVYTFVREMDRLSFPEAVEQLAQRAGVPLPERTGPVRHTAQTEDKAILYRANEWACEIFQEALASDTGEKARRYLKERGISAESIKKFRIGYAPDAWDTLTRRLSGKEKHLPALKRAGLILERQQEGAGPLTPGSYYDRFRNRVVFPILDVQDRVVGFGARSLDGSEPKYLNSPETPVFNKRRQLYALPFARNAARQTKRLVLAEGYTDVIMAHQHGFGDFVATLGTALTPEHIVTARRYADEIIVLYDGDEAGRNAANRSVELFVEGEMPARFAPLPSGEDPCSLLVNRGTAALEQILATALGPVEFLLAPSAQLEGEDTEKKAGRIDSIIALLARVPNPVRRELWVGELAELARIGEASIRERLAALTRATRPRPVAGNDQTADERKLKALDAHTLEVALKAPHLRDRILASGLLDGLHDPQVAQLCREMAQSEPVDISQWITRIDHPALVDLVVRLSEQTIDEADYEKALDGCIRQMQSERATRETAALNEQLAQADAAGDETRQLELLREIHRVNDFKSRSLHG